MTCGVGQIHHGAGEYHVPPSDSTSPRMRKSSSASSSLPSSLNLGRWAKTKTGQHVANVYNYNEINVVNDLGVDNRGNKRRADKGNMCLVTFQNKVVAILMITIIWFATQVYLIRGAPYPDNAIALRGSVHASQATAAKMEDTKFHSIFELSHFWNKPPQDFQAPRGAGCLLHSRLSTIRRSHVDDPTSLRKMGKQSHVHSCAY